jgi:periplasmic divalent cation tolerance protein
VQVLGPVRSTYRWQGEVEVAEEWLCLVKTEAGAYPSLEAAILDLHPYDTPEMIALPVSAGSGGYLSWVEREVSGGS